MKVDLHNHTAYSFDSTITFKDLKRAFERGKFDVIAITDHDTIEGALQVQKARAFPVIVGQEISTKQGDVIGLFLKKQIPKGLSASEAMNQIHAQGGLVYLPHPFDVYRVGVKEKDAINLTSKIDLIEVYNGSYGSRLFNRYFEKINNFADQHNLVKAAGSDAHTPSELGSANVLILNDSLQALLTTSGLLSAIRKGKLNLSSSHTLLTLGKRAFNIARAKLGIKPSSLEI